MMNFLKWFTNSLKYLERTVITIILFWSIHPKWGSGTFIYPEWQNLSGGGMMRMNPLFAAHDWLAKNSAELDKYAGKWVAVGEAELLGVADTLKKLKKLPSVKSAKNPLFTIIPGKLEEYSLTF
jgi:hypothetical protein